MKLRRSITFLSLTTLIATASSLVFAQDSGPRPTPIPRRGNPTIVTPPPASPGSTPAPAPPPSPPPPPPPANNATPGKQVGDTGGLTQFKSDIDFEPRPPGFKVSFSLEDADLPELIKVMGQLTGRRFIFSGKVRNIKATIYCPEKVTVAEAYQAFLSILEANGLTVVPSGRFLKVIETGGGAMAGANSPVIGPGQSTAPEDRYITRLHRLSYTTVDDVGPLLNHYKSKDGDVGWYPPGNLLILIDTASNIRRMLSLVEQFDVPSIGDQIWVEPIHYAGAAEIATKVSEIFDVNKGGQAASRTGIQLVDTRVTKVIPEERSNSLIIMGTEKAYTRIIELVRRLDVPMSGEGEIHVLALQHADAEELSKTLQEIIGAKGATPTPAPTTGPAGQNAPRNNSVFEGAIRVTADKFTNSLIVVSSMRDYASLRNVIDRLDQARRQVYIEAVIMEVSTQRTNKLGTSAHGVDQLDALGGIDAIGGINALGSPSSISFPNIADQSSLQGLALGIISSQSLTIPGIGLSLPPFGIALQALTTNSDSNVLLTPHIMATDNVAAEFKIKQEISIQTSVGSIPNLGSAAGGSTAALGLLGGFGTSQFQRTPVTSTFKFTPHINDSNEIRLELEEEISDTEPSANGNTSQPNINTRSAKTQLVIQDQQTIVIAGLVRDVTQNQETKVPILGDIPLLGVLFKQTTHTIQKRNLLLVLTPYVIRDPTDLRQIFERKMRERQEFIDRNLVFNNDADFKPSIDYTRTHGLLEDIRQSYIKADEKAKRDEANRPREIKGHAPSAPISDMPISRNGNESMSPAPAAPGPAPAPPPPAPPGPAPVEPPKSPPRTVQPGTHLIRGAISI